MRPATSRINSHTSRKRPGASSHHDVLRKIRIVDLAVRLEMLLVVTAVATQGGLEVFADAGEDDHDDAAEADGEGEEIVQHGASGRHAREAERSVG